MMKSRCDDGHELKLDPVVCLKSQIIRKIKLNSEKIQQILYTFLIAAISLIYAVLIPPRLEMKI